VHRIGMEKTPPGVEDYPAEFFTAPREKQSAVKV